MQRRTLLSLAAGAAVAATGGPAAAGGRGGDEPPPSMNMTGLGLPVIAGGRIRNYVFVTLRLHLGRGRTPESLRAKEPYFRDALVRAGHRTPFILADDWSRLDAAALSASLIASADRIAGRGAIARVEVVSQSPRRQTGVRPG